MQKQHAGQQQCVARARADEVEGKAAQYERSIFEAKGQNAIDREKQRQKIKRNVRSEKLTGKLLS